MSYTINHGQAIKQVPDTKPVAWEEMEMHFGATYSTESHNFGEITSVFVVDADWDGYRFHGYCRPSAADIAAFGY